MITARGGIWADYEVEGGTQILAVHAFDDHGYALVLDREQGGLSRAIALDGFVGLREYGADQTVMLVDEDGSPA